MTPSNEKIRVAVVYGGRSGEHEISLQSAASVIRNLDPDKFEIVPIGIDKGGQWHLNDLSLIQQEKGKAIPLNKDTPPVVLPPFSEGNRHEVVPFKAGGAGSKKIDVVFPVMHGPLCEDGSIQGLFELSNIPYVGAGVLGSAIGMDKDVAKRLARAAGIKVGPYISIRLGQWERAKQYWVKEVSSSLQFPVFVKPANMGSSVGVYKVADPKKLQESIEDAFQYDQKVLIEQGIDAREIELSVLESIHPGELPLVSIAGEIIPRNGFYSYQAKYLDEQGAQLVIPAKLSDEQMRKCQKMAVELFQVLECEAMARVDLFLDRKSGEFYFNEVNTIPGFTVISMYPKLWEASGLSYKELLTRLVNLAVDRHKRKNSLVRDWHSEE